MTPLPKKIFIVNDDYARLCSKSFVLEFTERPLSYFWAIFELFNDDIWVIAVLKPLKGLLARPWQELAQLFNYECDIWTNWKNIHYSKILNQPVILTLLSLVNTATILPHTVVHSQVGSTKVCRNFTCLLYFSLTICNVKIRI